MNCSHYQQQLNAYIAGQLPEDASTQLSDHIESCETCSRAYNTLLITEKLIEKESSVQVNPYLSTRVMAQIENKATESVRIKQAFSFNSILQPILVAALVIIAITIGVRVGNTYSKQVYASGDVPQELLYMNDAAMESIEILISD